ncbi:MAG: type II secretion system F family protein [Desulfuromonadales bacterium]|nr:type II secretion system F family protein [Desulfuromonadales bacterium]
MNSLTILILCSVFLFVFLLVVVVYGILNEGKFAEKRAVKKRLLFMSAGGKHGQEKLAHYRNAALKDVGAFEQMLLKLPRISSLDRMLVKAKVSVNASVFILASFGLALLGFLLGYTLLHRISSGFLIGLLLGLVPLFMLRIAVRSYYDKFQEQLPEALDLLGRALRSGHALTSGLNMVAEESVDPIKGEFSITVDELKLGLTVKEAFDNLCQRVPSPDLRFFVVAVTIQRETGGNLAEILDSISRLIRERVQFGRHVQTLTAEGRLSAWVLISLPFIMFLYIYFANYDYISMLWTEQVGLILLVGGIVSQMIGAYVMKRIVAIEI